MQHWPFEGLLGSEWIRLRISTFPMQAPRQVNDSLDKDFYISEAGWPAIFSRERKPSSAGLTLSVETKDRINMPETKDALPQ